MPPELIVSVDRVPPPVTYPLRQRVLRPGRPLDAARLAVDAHPRTAAFAARTAARVGPTAAAVIALFADIDDDGIVGTASVTPEPCPWAPERTGAWRLRGMATDPAVRGRGVGEQVLRAALDHVRAAGGRLVWCNARVPARRFYERAGFAVHGDDWMDPEHGPHVCMWRPLAPASAPPS